MFCTDCPVKGTQFCHVANPKAKRYTRSQKELIRRRINDGELREWETLEDNLVGTARSASLLEEE